MTKILITVMVTLSTFAYAQEMNMQAFDTIQTENGLLKVNDVFNKRYGISKGDSLMRVARTIFYFRKKDYDKYVKEYISYMSVYDLTKTASEKNDASWRVFEYATDKKDLLIAEGWILEAYKKEPMNPYFLDTWANILYKMGKIELAIEKQTQAVWIGQFNSVFSQTLFRIKTNRPTWKFPAEVPSTKGLQSDLEVWKEIEFNFQGKMKNLMWRARLNEIKLRDNAGYVKMIFLYVDELNPKRSNTELNSHAWSVFEYSNSKPELKKALEWSKVSLADSTNNILYAFMDTYANLLHKLGRKKEAVLWEEKALALCPEKEKSAYKGTLAKMEKGEKTWE